jgi:hypothetical protein
MVKIQTASGIRGAEAASSSWRQRAAASFVIKVRRPTRMTRGPRPSRASLKNKAELMLFLRQNSGIDKASNSPVAFMVVHLYCLKGELNLRLLGLEF